MAGLNIFIAQITDTYLSNVENALSGDILLVYAVVLVCAVFICAVLGIKSWIGYAIAIAIVSAFTYMFVGGFPLIIPVCMIILLFVLHQEGTVK